VILLKLISFMLLTSEDLSGHLPELIKLLTTYEQVFSENDEGLGTLAEIASTLTQRLPTLEHEKLVSAIFSIFLTVESSNSIAPSLRQ
jgi:hypothetical protein